MQLEAVYLTTTSLSAKRKTSVIVSSSCALRHSSWELNVASLCAGRNKQSICSLHRKTIGVEKKNSWLAKARVFWGEYEEFRSVQPRRLTSSSRCSPGGNSTGGQREGNQCVTAPRPKSRLPQTRAITSLMIPHHVRLRHVPPMGGALPLHLWPQSGCASLPLTLHEVQDM